jgi:hypothetical protein
MTTRIKIESTHTEWNGEDSVKTSAEFTETSLPEILVHLKHFLAGCGFFINPMSDLEFINQEAEEEEEALSSLIDMGDGVYEDIDGSRFIKIAIYDNEELDDNPGDGALDDIRRSRNQDL